MSAGFGSREIAILARGQEWWTEKNSDDRWACFADLYRIPVDILDAGPEAIARFEHAENEAYRRAGQGLERKGFIERLPAPPNHPLWQAESRRKRARREAGDEFVATGQYPAAKRSYGRRGRTSRAFWFRLTPAGAELPPLK